MILRAELLTDHVLKFRCHWLCQCSSLPYPCWSNCIDCSNVTHPTQAVPCSIGWRIGPCLHSSSADCPRQGFAACDPQQSLAEPVAPKNHLKHALSKYLTFRRSFPPFASTSVCAGRAAP